MDGVHAAGVSEGVTVDGLQVGGNQSGLPVVALDHVGDIIQNGHGIQTGAGEVSETLTVVGIAVDGAVTAAEVVQIVHKVDLHTVGALL